MVEAVGKRGKKNYYYCHFALRFGVALHRLYTRENSTLSTRRKEKLVRIVFCLCASALNGAESVIPLLVLHFFIEARKIACAVGR